MSTDSWTFPQDLLKKIPPQHYLHVLDNNTNVVRVEIGPQTYRCKDQEAAVYGPTKMIVIPPRHFVIISNPVVKRMTKEEKWEVVCDKFGQAILRHGDQEVRLEQEPFPLYPGEVISERVRPLEVVEPNTALRLQATRDFEDRYAKDSKGRPLMHKAGEEWYFEGPATYIPQPEVRIVNTTKATVVQPGQALRLTTRHNFTDRTDKQRLAGSEWHYSQEGFFLPDIREQILKVEQPTILTDKTALHLRAEHHFVDCFGIERLAGSEWLVTNKMTEAHIPHVFAKVVGTVNITTLGKREWMVIQNPVDESGRPQYGKKLLLKGEKNFFLHPGELFEHSVPQQVYVLTADKALLVQSIKSFTDNSTGTVIARTAGEKWLIFGPKEYWPPLEVKVMRTISAFIQLGSVNLFKPDSFALIVLAIFLALYILWCLVSLVV